MYDAMAYDSSQNAEQLVLEKHAQKRHDVLHDTRTDSHFCPCGHLHPILVRTSCLLPSNAYSRVCKYRFDNVSYACILLQ